MGDKYQCIINDWIVFIEPKGFGGVEDVLDIALSSEVAIQVEQGEEVVYFFQGEDWVLGHNILCENGLSLFIGDLFLVDCAHLA